MSEVTQIGKDEHVRGSPGAELVIVEYGDYQCPYTARARAVLDKLGQRFGDRMCLVYRHLPLAHRHPLAQAAAEAAEAAGAQGKFWEMHEALFAHQDKLAPDILPRLAEDIELDEQRFRDDMQARRYRERVEADTARAHAEGATGTPTFFINGQRYHGDSDEASLTRAIESALQ
jgi:protein-disulfide isomerase